MTGSSGGSLLVNLPVSFPMPYIERLMDSWFFDSKIPPRNNAFERFPSGTSSHKSRPGHHWLLHGCQLCHRNNRLAIIIRPGRCWVVRGRQLCCQTICLAIRIRPGRHWVLHGRQFFHQTNQLAIRLRPLHHWVVRGCQTLPKTQSTGNWS